MYLTLLCKYFRSLECQKENILCKSMSLKPSDSLEPDKAQFKTSSCKLAFTPAGPYTKVIQMTFFWKD